MLRKGFCTRRYLNDNKRLLPKEKNKNAIATLKKKLGGKIMPQFVTLRAKMYA